MRRRARRAGRARGRGSSDARAGRPGEAAARGSRRRRRRSTRPHAEEEPAAEPLGGADACPHGREEALDIAHHEHSGEIAGGQAHAVLARLDKGLAAWRSTRTASAVVASLCFRPAEKPGDARLLGERGLGRPLIARHAALRQPPIRVHDDIVALAAASHDRVGAQSEAQAVAGAQNREEFLALDPPQAACRLGPPLRRGSAPRSRASSLDPVEEVSATVGPIGKEAPELLVQPVGALKIRQNRLSRSASGDRVMRLRYIVVVLLGVLGWGHGGEGLLAHAEAAPGAGGRIVAA